MNELLVWAIAAAAAYLIGSLNGSLLVTRFLLRDDIRKHGSGNAGSTNMLRTYGVKLTLPVAIWDMAKGVGAILLARWIVVLGNDSGGGELLPDAMTPDDALLIGTLIGAFFVIAGHVFPLFFHFKGGKGVITSLAVLLMVDWVIALISFGCFLLVVCVWRFISLGSLTAFSLYLALTAIFHRDEPIYLLLVIPLTLLVFVLHRENIRRLRKGTESKFGQKKST